MLAMSSTTSVLPVGLDTSNTLLGGSYYASRKNTSPTHFSTSAAESEEVVSRSYLRPPRVSVANIAHARQGCEPFKRQAAAG